MKLTFIGADHEVTGSCHLVEACGKNILVDCGMEQGPDLYENQEIPVASGDIEYSPDACTYRSLRKDSDALQTGISRRNRNNICHIRFV